MNVIKLNSLARWRNLEAGKAIHFADVGRSERRICLTVNTHLATALWLRNADGEERLLACLTPGLNKVEFYAAGPFAVVPSDGDNELWYQTAEAEPNHVVIADPVIYTGIPERRQRNPQLEMIMYAMRQNLAARDAHFAAELAKLKGERENVEAAKGAVHEPKAQVPAADKVGTGPKKGNKKAAPVADQLRSPGEAEGDEPDAEDAVE